MLALEERLDDRVVTAAPIAGAAAVLTALAVRDPNVPGSWGACPFHAVTGLWCPGCGALRGLHHLVHLDVAATVASNALLLPGLFVLAWAWLAWSSRRLGRTRPFARLPDTPWFATSCAVAVLVFTVARNLPGSVLAP